MCLPFCYTHRLTRLPRPSDPRNPYAAAIWHPPSLHSADSAALRDFGFPSTHSVNAVTNAGMVLMYVAPGPGVLLLCSGPRVCCYLPVCCRLLHVLRLVLLHPRLFVRAWSIAAISSHKSLSPTDSSPAHRLLHSPPHNPLPPLFSLSRIVPPSPVAGTCTTRAPCPSPRHRCSPPLPSPRHCSTWSLCVPPDCSLGCTLWGTCGLAWYDQTHGSCVLFFVLY